MTALKRALDLLVAGPILMVLSPVLAVVALAIWLTDRRSPFYRPCRIGLGGRTFRMVKFRSMVVDADLSGVSSTSVRDPRITPIGAVLRRYKLDEIPQLWNVLVGSMSLVGPRPNVPSEVEQYTEVERGLLGVPPGVTDLASIAFSDEAEILRDSCDPDSDYNRHIRPWKSRLGLLYVKEWSLGLDISILRATAVALLWSRDKGLAGAAQIAKEHGADDLLCSVIRRDKELASWAPPGAYEPVGGS